MKTIRKNICDLTAPEKNVRIHTKKQIAEFVKSIKMFGQIRPVVVDENNVILAGNGLVEALLEMGETQADVLVVLNLSENQKKKLMIADNKIFSLGIENLETLNAFLEELQGDLDIPGFDEEILKSMMSSANEITDQLSTYGTLNQDEIKSIQDSGERKEIKMAKVEESQAEQQQPPVENNIPINENTKEQTNVETSVVCPHCGETIWL